MRIRANTAKILKPALLAIAAGLLALCPLTSSSADENPENEKIIEHQDFIQKWIAGAESLSRKQIKAMSAEEFIGVLKTHTLVWIGDGEAWSVKTEIRDWPDKKDIPYLLTQVESIEPCAKTVYPTFSIVPEDYTTVRKQALYLLTAIKQGEYSLHVKSEDEHELIAWAREEAAKLGATK